MEKKSIYIMKGVNGKCKIGVSSNPKTRLEQLKTGNPDIELVYESKPTFIAYKIESIIHKQFGFSSCGHEWFWLSDISIVIEFIEKQIRCLDDKKPMDVQDGFEKKSNDLFDKVFLKDLKTLEQEIAEEKLENSRIQNFVEFVFGFNQDCDYGDLVYASVFGKNAKQLREEYGIDKKENLRDYFSQDELQMIQSKEMLVSGLIGCGWGYEQIKNFILQNNLLSIAG